MSMTVLFVFEACPVAPFTYLPLCLGLFAHLCAHSVVAIMLKYEAQHITMDSRMYIAQLSVVLSLMLEHG